MEHPTIREIEDNLKEDFSNLLEDYYRKEEELQKDFLNSINGSEENDSD